MERIASPPIRETDFPMLTMMVGGGIGIDCSLIYDFEGEGVKESVFFRVNVITARVGSFCPAVFGFFECT